MKILLTNDDGISAQGLDVLTVWAREHGHHVVVTAPKDNRSGQSGAITLGKPLTVTDLGSSRWAVGGTPADCVRIALGFLGFHPDLVISGINHGANLGQDVHASGTVGAARMAAIRGIPAIAVSAQGSHWDLNARLWSRHAPAILTAALAHGPSEVISVNFPVHGGETLTTAELSGPRYDDQMQWAEFEDQHHIVWLEFQERAVDTFDAGTDADVLSRGLSTLTYLPLVPARLTEQLPARSPA